ncbi:uncharacterized protein G2W53_003991 [Senna tora]|uniref:Uncharacterized protein n=1 Tax=Senna tora TaxID=362788 RepID=A0A834XEG9_9FABA|nr:uncharacterized protein G2W53_003991 [Senna tora]
MGLNLTTVNSRRLEIEKSEISAHFALENIAKRVEFASAVARHSRTLPSLTTVARYRRSPSSLTTVAHHCLKRQTEA